jgi:hypothetical protein
MADGGWELRRGSGGRAAACPRRSRLPKGGPGGGSAIIATLVMLACRGRGRRRSRESMGLQDRRRPAATSI